MTEEFSTPAWVHDAIFYQIFPDRFASSAQVEKPTNLEAWDAPPTPEGFKGGDLLGVVEHLDYLQDLGITAIYFTPVFQSTANHRYHTHDYFRVDPILGGDQAFRTLLNEAHRRGMRIVLDGVFNHASRGFFQFNHILENGAASPYLDWFTVHNHPANAYEGKPNYDCWIGLPALPEFNTRNTQVRKFIFDVARYWIDQGIDGWRLDVPFEIDDDTFWQEFRQVVKSANPDAYLIGEIPYDATRWLQGDQFDGVMNYVWTYACWSFFTGENYNEAAVGHWRSHFDFSADTAIFAQTVEGLLKRYSGPSVAAQLNLLDSHDTSRFLTIASGNMDLLRLALLFNMTYPGAPCIYYGDEIGLEGTGDPGCRVGFPWDPNRWDHDLLDDYKRYISLRKSRTVLRSGDYHTLYAAQGQYAFLRTQENDRLLIALNRTSSRVPVRIPVNSLIPDGTVLQNIIGTGTVQVRAGVLEDLVLPAYGGVVLG